MITTAKRVLVLAPHTDDAELGCGGSLARLLECGVEVWIAAFSTARQSLPPGQRPTLLKEEFHRAMDIFQISDDRRLVYDYEVRKLSYYRQEVLEELVRLRSEIEPDTILLPSGSDLHQDHQVLFQEGMRAFKERSVWGYELPWNHIGFNANAFVQLEERHLDLKWRALLEYRSQIEKGRDYFRKEFIYGLATVRGVQVRTSYAEAFEVLRIRT